mgnify:CR=1 FL=1
MTATAILLFTIVVAASAATQAVTGFGFTLLALGILGWWMELREASVLLAPAGLAMNLLLFIRLRHHFAWNGHWPLFLAAFAGVPVGVVFLLQVDLRLLELVLAAVMFVGAAQGLRAIEAEHPTVWHPVWAGVPLGALGGILAGAFGLGGPPVVSFLLNRPLNRFQFVTTIQALFTMTSTVRVTQLVWLGKLDRSDLPTVVPAIAAASFGAFTGLHLLHRMSDRLVRRLVLWFVVACGLRYLWAALM